MSVLGRAALFLFLISPAFSQEKEEAALGEVSPAVPKAVAASPFPTDDPDDHLKSLGEKTEKRRGPGFAKFAAKVKEVSREVEAAEPQDRQVVIDKSLPELNALAGELGDREVNNDVAYLNNRRGNWAKAIGLAEFNLELDPNDRDALINKSVAQHGLGRFDESFETASKAVDLKPDDPAARTARALASYGKGDYLQALEDAQRALAADPNDRTAFSLLKLAEARVKPASPILKNAKEAEVQREYQGMVSQLNRVETKRQEPTPEAPPQTASLNKAVADKIALKDYWAAIAAADRAIAASQSDPDSYFYRAAAHNLTGQHEKAVEDATQALALSPAHTAARDARSWAFYRLGRYREAIADANHSLEVDPKNAYAFANRGYANERIGDMESMLIDFKMAASLNPQFEPAYRDAAAMNQVPAEGLRGRPAPPPGRVYAPRKDSFVVIIVSSIVGGFLIALGLLHVISGQWSRKMSTEIRRIQTASRPLSNLESGYKILGPIGQGGMGVVYEAIDRGLDRKVAIKALRPELSADPREREHLLREARTVASLRHPSIVEIYSILDDDAGLYLIFERVHGRSVHDLICERKRLTLNEAKAILKPVCQALEYAHHRHIVHRDLKPANIMITDEGQVKVMDFGIARHDQRSTATGSAPGTPPYMAPEQESGVVRKESDVYGLGACLYEMVTGERPFDGDEGRKKRERSYERPSRLVLGLPPELDSLIDAALHPDPDRRLPSAKEFWAALDAVSVHS